MSVIQSPIPVVCTTGTMPNVKFASCTDNLSAVTTAGFFNSTNQGTTPITEGNIVFLYYNVVNNGMTVTGTNGIFSASVSNLGVVTLTNLIPENTTGIEYNGTGAGPGIIPTFTDVTGNEVTGQNPVIGNPYGSIYVGDQSSSGVFGAFFMFPETINTGFLRLAATSNSGNYNITVTNAAFGQATALTIPDPGAATANFVLNTGATTMAAGSKISLSSGTGSGNSVSINAQSGYITTAALTTAGGASQAITLTNSLITATTKITLTLMTGGTNNATSNIGFSYSVTGGSATINVINNTAATALNGTVMFSFILT